MKILYVVHQFFPLFHTGSERLTLDTAKQMQRMGNFVSVLTYAPNPPLEKTQNQSTKADEGFEQIDKFLMKKEYQFGTIPVIAIKYTKHTLGFGIFDPNMEKHMSEIVKKFDLLHFIHPMFFCSALKACKKLGIPTVLTLTDTWLLSPRSLVTSEQQLCDGPDEGRKCMKLCHYGSEVLSRYKEAKFFFENIDGVFAASNFIRRTFKQNNWNRNIELVPFSIDHSHVKPVDDPQDTVFGFFGTFIWHKGLDVLIKAFTKVENKKIKLKIYGRGDERDPYVNNLNNLARNDKRIEFLGTFDYGDLPNIMKGISVMVIPSSYKENFPLVMQLSLAYRKPIIASNIGGIPEVVKDGVNGQLFEAGNVEQLAKIIYTLSENPASILLLKNGIKSPPRIEGEALQYENTYRELCNNSSSKRKTKLKLSLEDKNLKIKNIETKNYKLLFLSHNLNLEGAPRVLYFLVKELKKLGHEITVVSPSDGPLKDNYLKEGIKVLIEPSFSGTDNIDSAFFQRFDLIILNTILNSVFVDTLRNIGKPVILVIHESEREFYMSQVNREPHLKNANKVIFGSDATRKIYSELEFNNNFYTIHPAIDIDEIESFKQRNDPQTLRKKYGISPSDKVVTIVGTIIPRKGQMIFSEAAIKLLESKNQNLHFFMVGAIETDYLKEIKKKISKHSDKIHIIPITEHFEYLLISDIFVCCSFIESFPAVTLDAMAFELPIIATNVYGIPEQIEDNKQGILIPPGNSDLLAQKIEFLLNNPELAQSNAKNAYQKLKKSLSLSQEVNSYDNLIRETIEAAK